MIKEKIKHLPINLLISLPIFVGVYILTSMFSMCEFKNITITILVYLFFAVHLTEIDYLQEQLHILKNK